MLKLNELDPSEGIHSAEAALCVAFRDCGSLWPGQDRNKTIDCTCSPTDPQSAALTNTVFVFVAHWFPGGELTVEQDHIDYVFIDLRGRDFRGLKCNSVPLLRETLRRRSKGHAGAINYLQ